METEGNSGPRFDSNGNVIAHSILGTLEEYKLGAETKGETTFAFNLFKVWCLLVLFIEGFFGCLIKN